MTPTVSDIQNKVGSVPAASNVGETREGINVLDLLIVLAGRKKWIASVTAIATALVVAIVLVLPNRYTATAKILPPQQSQSVSSALAGQLAGLGAVGAIAGGNLGLKNPSDIYVGMLKSRTVEDALIRRFGLVKVYRDRRVSDAEKDLEKASAISSSKEGFISISVEDKDGRRAAAVANAYVEELRSLMQRVAVTEAGQRRLFFEQQVNQARNSLASAEDALKEVQQKTGMIQLDGQAKAIIESVVELRAKIAAKEVQVQAMRSFATSQNPDYAIANQELSGLRAQLARMESQQSGGVGDVAIPTGSMPQAGLEYLRRVRDVKYYESIYEMLAKQHEAAKLDEARQGAVVQVVDPAVEPDAKSSPRRGLLIGIAGIVALLGSCLWVVLAESLKRLREVEPEQARRLTLLKHVFLSRSPRIGRREEHNVGR